MRTARVGGSSIIGEPRGTWHAVGVMSDLSTLIRVTERERGVGEGVVEIENESARILLRFPRSPITTRYYLTSLSLYIYIASEQLRETLSFLAYIFLPRLGEGKHFSLLISKKKGKNGWRV